MSNLLKYNLWNINLLLGATAAAALADRIKFCDTYKKKYNLKKKH
jgi:hypothetical protein